MKRILTPVVATLLLGLASLQSGFAQCYELGTTVGQLSPILKNPIGFCPGIAQLGAVCDCPAGFVAVGYEGLEGNVYGGMVLSQFKLRCKQLNSNGTLGAAVTVTCSNGTSTVGTLDGPIDAAANQGIVGAEVRIGCAMDAVMGASKPILDIAAGLPNSTSNSMTGIGGTGGAPQPVMYVPNGNVIVGMQTYVEPLNQPAGAIGITAGVAWRYAPIVACPVMLCSLNTIVVNNISACNNNGTPSNPADDFFTADVTVTFSNPPATGTLNLSGDGTASVAVGSLGAGTYTFTGVQMSADGSAINLTAAFSADATCTLTNSNAGTAPGSCSVVPPSCSVNAITVGNISACNSNGTLANTADDTFTANVTVTFSNPPASGTLNLSGSGVAAVPVGSLGAGTYTFIGVTMPANGQPINLSASFSANPTCSLTNPNAGTAPANCSPNAPTIPTMSEWGLILFALIVFTMMVVFGTQKQNAFALSSADGQVSGNSRQGLPFNKALYFKALPMVYLGFAVVFAIATKVFGYEMTSADLPGSLLAGGVIAYLVQFVISTSRNK
ncbi:MAG: IPTL-CTERM sorting domain-containing protein [Lewinellaceae bacterium]|nr:IPTL-CTERM sorting domain-containing protein [Saprospiraceae bacterium]MCB9336916.1 IPTL-CTERM sorting domain-containing protein [Lewinellaceae bacterium]